MPVRATKRGAERTPLTGDCDVLICGASFAGLAVARELARTGARVLVLDRYEIGERQTSACAASRPSGSTTLGPRGPSGRPSAVVVHTPHGSARWPLPGRSRPSTTGSVRAAVGAVRRRRVRDRQGRRPDGRSSTPTAATCARRSSSTRSAGAACSAPGDNVQPPGRAALARPRGPPVRRRRRARAVDRPALRAPGYCWSFPADDELRVGVGSFDPRHHVKEPTPAAGRGPRPAAEAVPGQLDPAPDPPGGRGRRVLRRRLRRPLPAADGRGHPHRAVLRLALRARAARGRRGPPAQARRARRYAAFSARTRWKFDSMLGVQRRCRGCHRRLDALVRLVARARRSRAGSSATT